MIADMMACRLVPSAPNINETMAVAESGREAVQMSAHPARTAVD
ncbi:hypothetical protein TRICHSKD4_4597 [Roseibium sp. TrichSKD4]|nr:hypothetical protein TRICHSKD4_4597 [Roseibium sp. TrichSKD4]